MTSSYLPFALTVGGMLLYHLSQKSINSNMNPFHATMIAYVVGILVCGVAAFSYGDNKSLAASFKSSNWAVFAMGVGAASIEVGFMIAYRLGWRISVAAVATNVAATAILIPIGLLIFKEHLSLRAVIGIIFCVAGLLLVARD
jgi:uncharacterized membrane protein